MPRLQFMTPRFRLAKLLGQESRYAFAKRAGLSYPTVSAIYHNTAQGVTLAVLGKLAVALGCSPGDLFERTKRAGSPARTQGGP